MKPTKTLRSLREIAEATAAGADFSYLLADFLDAFYQNPSREALEEEPVLLGGPAVGESYVDAFLAGAAELLAGRERWTAPGWIFEPERYLRHPYFPVTASGLRATLLLESPPAFRARNIFVTGNALSRA